jgi:O-antigen/teichoic acid export membrane protein
VLGAAAELTRGRLLARNVGLNVAGWVLPAVCALLAIPALVRAMGAERFGLLALAWTLVGSFSPFDLGIGRALTQALSERVGRADQGDSPDIAWAAGWLLLGVGVAGGAGLALAAAPLAERWLHVSPALQGEATRSLRLLALAVPLTVLTSGLRGVLEAGQAFRAVNALRVPLALLTFAGPWAVQPFSHGLPAAIAVLVGARALVCGLHAGVVARRYPALRRVRGPRAAALRSLSRVAGWMTLSTLSNPVLVTGDRLLIGAALPMAAFAQYAAVSEVASKLGVVGAVLQPVLFPALAATLAADPRRATMLFDRGVRATALAVAPAALVLVAFAPEGLRAWLGADLARDAAPVLQLLAITAYVNTCAHMPLALLQSGGRPDLPAKFHALEVPLYLVALWLLLGRFGLLGAAIAGAGRIAFDTLALYGAVPLVLQNSRPVLGRALALTVGGAAALAACAMVGPLQSRAALAAVTLAGFAWAGRRWLVTPGERALVGQWAATRRTGRPAPATTATTAAAADTA